MIKDRAQTRDRRRFWGLMVVAVVLIIIAVLTSIQPSEFVEIAFIDVGQGDSACVITPQGDVVIIDGGEDDSFKHDILPFLVKRGIFSVDYVVASHYHTDHTDGLVDLLEVMPVETLIIPDVDYDDEIKDKLIALANKKNVRINEVTANDKIEVSEDLFLEVLFPDSDIFLNKEENKNNDSIVLRLGYFDTTVLFTGDLEADAERALVRENDVVADILKVGHHGSYTSTSQEFLEEVGPSYAVISAGRNNSHGHPHDTVVKRLKKRGAGIYRTDKNGNIIFKADKNGIRKIEVEKISSTE